MHANLSTGLAERMKKKCRGLRSMGNLVVLFLGLTFRERRAT